MSGHSTGSEAATHPPQLVHSKAITHVTRAKGGPGTEPTWTGARGLRVSAAVQGGAIQTLLWREQKFIAAEWINYLIDPLTAGAAATAT